MGHLSGLVACQCGALQPSMAPAATSCCRVSRPAAVHARTPRQRSPCLSGAEAREETLHWPPSTRQRGSGFASRQAPWWQQALPGRHAGRRQAGRGRRDAAAVSSSLAGQAASQGGSPASPSGRPGVLIGRRSINRRGPPAQAHGAGVSLPARPWTAYAHRFRTARTPQPPQQRQIRDRALVASGRPSLGACKPPQLLQPRLLDCWAESNWFSSR